MAKRNTQTTEIVSQAIAFDTLKISDDCVKYTLSAERIAEHAAATGNERLFNVLTVSPDFFVRGKFPRASKGNHQVADCYRVEGCNPLMPNLSLILTTGNAYPNDVASVAQVKVSAEKYSYYRDNVFIAHHVFNALASDVSDKGLSACDLYASADLFAKASADKGKQITQANNTNGNAIFYGISDTLRDMELFGIVYAVNAKNGTRTTKTYYKMNDEYKRVHSDILSRKVA